MQNGVNCSATGKKRPAQSVGHIRAMSETDFELLCQGQGHVTKTMLRAFRKGGQVSLSGR